MVGVTGCGCPVDTSVCNTEAPTEAAAETLNPWLPLAVPEILCSLRVTDIIRTRLKTVLFKFFGVSDLKAAAFLHPQYQKSNKNNSFSGRRFFTVRIFGETRHKAQKILYGFSSILTKYRRKSACKKRVWITSFTLYSQNFDRCDILASLHA